MKKKLKKESGLTLIELLVVITILGLLASIMLVSLKGARIKARDIRRVAEIEQIKKAIEIYYTDHGEYPDVYDQNLANGWSALLEILKNEGMLSQDFPSRSKSSNLFNPFNYALAALGGGCPENDTPQDPFYECVDGIPNSYTYGYMVSDDKQNHRLRTQFENQNSPVLNSGLSGKFLDDSTTGDTACDKNLGYYCIGLYQSFAPKE